MSDDEILAMADAVSVKMRVREYDENLLAFARAVERAARAAAFREAADYCDSLVADEIATGKVDHNEIAWTQHCAIALRARAEGGA